MPQVNELSWSLKFFNFYILLSIMFIFNFSNLSFNKFIILKKLDFYFFI